MTYWMLNLAFLAAAAGMAMAAARAGNKGQPARWGQKGHSVRPGKKSHSVRTGQKSLAARPHRSASAGRTQKAGTAVVITFALLCLLTAAFDNIMIASGLFAYSDAHISGWRIGLAPLEDFAYVLAAALLLPALWTLLPAGRPTGRRKDAHGE